MEQPLLVIPEYALCNTIQTLFKVLREDYTAHINNVAESYLAKLTDQLQFQRLNWREQAIEIFTRDEAHDRYIEVDLMFNMQKNHFPSIHITLPSEQSHQMNSLNMGEAADEEDLLLDGDGNAVAQRGVMIKRYSATYNVVIASDNINEVVIIYHVLRALLTAGLFQLQHEGLESVKFSGQDIQPYSDIMPPNMYMRALVVGLEYETKTLSLHPEMIPKDLIFQPIIHV